MVAFIIALVLLLVALLALVLRKTYFYVPLKELKRQAAAKDKLAISLFSAAAYNNELQLLLWTSTILATAGGLVILVHLAPAVLGFPAVALLLTLVFAWLPRTQLNGVMVQTVERCTPAVVWLLRLLHPVSGPLTTWLQRNFAGPHTGMYEREDIDALLERQKQQADNRLSEADITRMQRVLHLGDYRVRDCMIPRAKVRSVNVDDTLGPVLITELHAAGHPYVPVYADTPTNLVGLLMIDNLTDVKRQGRVGDHYIPRLAFVHEADTLEQALRAFYETGQHLFIVVDTSEAYLGIITLRDILHVLFGAIEQQAFGKHDDRGAVAVRHRKQAAAHQAVAETPSEVIE